MGLGDIFDVGERIFRDRNALFHTTPPEKILFRDREILQLSLNLSYALKGSTPSHMLMLGLPGTGKTTVALYVIERFKEKIKGGGVSNVAVGYAVSDKTSYSTLVSLASDMGITLPLRGLSFKEAWSRFISGLRGKICILVIDEIDLLLMNDGRDLLYFVSRTPNIALIGISNVMNVLDFIKDPRVKSSFTPEIIVFDKYDVEQLTEIVKLRAEKAFREEAVEEEAIRLAAALAAQRGGDARFAMDLMLKAGDRAILEGRDKVTASIVRSVVEEVEAMYVNRMLQRLPISHKYLLYAIVKSSRRTPSEVYELYNKIAPTPLSNRRLSEILSELELFGLVKVDRIGRGRGRGVEFKISLASTLKRAIEELLKRELEA